VLTVGDQKVTEKEFELLIEALPEQYRAQARGPMKRQMAEQIARVKMLSAEARKRGLDKDAQTRSRIRFQEDNMLAGAAYNDLMSKVAVSDEAVEKYYTEHKNEYETIAARHILIKFKGSPVPPREGKPELTEEQALARANEVKKQLAGGGDFAALAKAESDDVGSGNNGGELGTFGRGQMVPEFEQAAFQLPVGQISEPVKTQFGYHLIRVDKHESKSLADVKDEIKEKLKPQVAQKAVEDMSKSAGIKLDDAYFGPETAAPAAGGGPGAAPAPAPVK
jgi:parvulin-like peptidyl-prolyl isomerase